MDITPDTDEGRWLTYRQIADLRGISKASAERLVRRHRWRRQEDNQGVTRALVPPEWTDVAPARSTADTSDIRADGAPDVTPAAAAFEAALVAVRETKDSEISTLRERAEAAERRADAADTDRRAAIALTEQSVAALAEAVVRADRAEQGREAASARVDALRDRLNAMQAQLADAHAALHAAEAADARAERAEQGREMERTRADALQERLGDTLAQLATAVADAKAAHDRAWAAGEQLAAAERQAAVERERADRAASGAAHERQDFLDAESRTQRELEAVRQRAEALHDRIEALQPELDAARATLVEERAHGDELRTALTEDEVRPWWRRWGWRRRR